MTSPFLAGCIGGKRAFFRKSLLRQQVLWLFSNVFNVGIPYHTHAEYSRNPCGTKNNGTFPPIATFFANCYSALWSTRPLLLKEKSGRKRGYLIPSLCLFLTKEGIEGWFFWFQFCTANLVYSLAQPGIFPGQRLPPCPRGGIHRS